jgi:hypothetical protein
MMGQMSFDPIIMLPHDGKLKSYIFFGYMLFHHSISDYLLTKTDTAK